MGMRRRGKGGTFMFEMRVPRRFRDVEPKEFERFSLGTDAEDLATRKHDQNKRLLIAKWEAMQSGRNGDAETYQKAIVDLCRASGYDYLPARDIAALPLGPLLDRVDQVPPRASVEVADALAGGSAAVDIPLSDLLGVFEQVVRADLVNKDARQMKKWRNDRDLVLREFQAVCGDLDLRAIEREHVSKYRRALTDRIVAGELVQNSANRRVQALGKMVKTVLWDRYGLRTDAFQEMGWREPKTKRRNTQVSYSPEYIQTRLLARGALDNLNEDARDIFLASVNTGAGPSELVNLNADTIRLDADVPHICIIPDGRELKNVYRERVLPLVGVSLDAISRHADGFTRYQNGDSVSNLINKYLRNNDLRETKDHTFKSLRHGFRDRLRNVGCPDSIAEELMGHVQAGTVYGEGVWLDVAQDWLRKIAF
jgi:integrase